MKPNKVVSAIALLTMRAMVVMYPPLPSHTNATMNETILTDICNATNGLLSECIHRLIDVYPEAVHMQNDDCMTPFERYAERAEALEHKLAVFQDSSGPQRRELDVALLAMRKLSDCIPHVLYVARMDPNVLEMALSANPSPSEQEDILLDLVKKAVREKRGGSGLGRQQEKDVGGEGGTSGGSQVRDRVEDLLDTLVGLGHVKSQVRGLRRTTEITDLQDSLNPSNGSPTRPSHMLFIGNPGTGKTTVGRLLAKLYHELGLLSKPKFLEVERLDLVGRTKEQTQNKVQEVLDEARGGVLFIDEAYTLGLSNRRVGPECGEDAIDELILRMSEFHLRDDAPLVIMAGFPEEMHQFIGDQPMMKKHFTLLFHFPDYTCVELARIFLDMAFAKGFDVSSDLTEQAIGSLLETETTTVWRRERNGRVSELLLSGVRTQVRMRVRTAAFEERTIDSQLILWEDVENVIVKDFK